MNKYLDFTIQKCIGIVVFFKVLLKAPFTTGMICPSSPFLTKKLAHQIPDSIILKLQTQHLHDLEKIRYKKEIAKYIQNKEKLQNTQDIINTISTPNSENFLLVQKSLENTSNSNVINSQILTALNAKINKNSEQENKERQAYIIELGAGTGAVTKALLQRGVPASRLIVFEQAQSMASLLRQRFPGIRIIQDDAAKMKNYIPKDAYIAFMISSLPFVSLPQAISENIISAIKDNIEDNHLIQYTYALHQKTLLEEKGFEINNKETVWFNLPPAHVLDYSFPEGKQG